MKNKFVQVLLGGIILLGLWNKPVDAETVRQTIRENIRQEKQEIRTQFLDEKMKMRNATGESKREMMNQLKDTVKKNIPKRIRGTLTAMNGSVLTISESNGTIFTVNVLSTTQLRRRFGAQATLSEFSVQDELAVIGNRHKVSDTEYSETEIDARYIRNMSIQRRNAVFNGTISTKGSDMFSIQTQSRGVQTVHVTGTTVFTQKDTQISFNDLQVGDRVIVKGELWDRAINQINAQKVMKLVRPTATQ